MLDNDIKLLEERRDELNRNLEIIKNRINNLKKPNDLEDCSTE